MTAGYSGTPLPKKLGIKRESRVLLAGAPAGFLATLGPVPEGVEFVAEAGGPVDVILLFVEREAALRDAFPRLAARLVPNGGFWVAWPKKASGRPTDLTFDVVQGVGLGHGLVDNKICAVDETWSGLRFVVRVKDRARR